MYNFYSLLKDFFVIIDPEWELIEGIESREDCRKDGTTCYADRVCCSKKCDRGSQSEGRKCVS